jgi:hypothetical protein
MTTMRSSWKQSARTADQTGSDGSADRVCGTAWPVASSGSRSLTHMAAVWSSGSSSSMTVSEAGRRGSARGLVKDLGDFGHATERLNADDY